MVSFHKNHHCTTMYHAMMTLIQLKKCFALCRNLNPKGIFCILTIEYTDTQQQFKQIIVTKKEYLLALLYCLYLLVIKMQFQLHTTVNYFDSLTYNSLNDTISNYLDLTYAVIDASGLSFESGDIDSNLAEITRNIVEDVYRNSTITTETIEFYGDSALATYLTGR